MTCHNAHDCAIPLAYPCINFLKIYSFHQNKLWFFLSLFLSACCAWHGRLKNEHTGWQFNSQYYCHNNRCGNPYTLNGLLSYINQHFPRYFADYVLAILKRRIYFCTNMPLTVTEREI